MANPAPQQSGGPKTSVKAPLMFSAALAAVAGIVTLVVSTGGTRHELRWDLAAIAFGVAFIVTLVVAAMRRTARSSASSWVRDPLNCCSCTNTSSSASVDSESGVASAVLISAAADTRATSVS